MSTIFQVDFMAWCTVLLVFVALLLPAQSLLSIQRGTEHSPFNRAPFAERA
jgi:hypothetical protein